MPPRHWYSTFPARLNRISLAVVPESIRGSVSQNGADIHHPFPSWPRQTATFLRICGPIPVIKGAATAGSNPAAYFAVLRPTSLTSTFRCGVSIRDWGEGLGRGIGPADAAVFAHGGISRRSRGMRVITPEFVVAKVRKRSTAIAGASCPGAEILGWLIRCRAWRDGSWQRPAAGSPHECGELRYRNFSSPMFGRPPERPTGVRTRFSASVLVIKQEPKNRPPFHAASKGCV